MIPEVPRSPTPADRLALWVARPENCTLLLAIGAAAVALVWWLTGEWSPLP